MSDQSRLLSDVQTDTEDKSPLPPAGNLMSRSTWKDLFSRAGAEFFGTMFLVFFITYGLSNNSTYIRSAIPGDGCSRPTVDQVALGLIGFFAASIPTALFGHVSGAHFNPAVTIVSGALGLVGGPWGGAAVGFWYIVWQFGGGLVGSLFAHAALKIDGTSVSDTTGNGMVCALDGSSFATTFFIEAVFSFVLVLAAITFIPKMMKGGKTLAPALLKGAIYGIAGISAGLSTNAGLNFWRYFSPWLLYMRDNSSEMGRYVLGNLVVGPIVAGIIVLCYWCWIDGDFYSALRREVDYFVSDLRTDRVRNAMNNKAANSASPGAEARANAEYIRNKTKQYNANYSDTQAPYATRLSGLRPRVLPGSNSKYQ